VYIDLEFAPISRTGVSCFDCAQVNHIQLPCVWIHVQRATLWAATVNGLWINARERLRVCMSGCIAVSSSLLTMLSRADVRNGGPKATEVCLNHLYIDRSYDGGVVGLAFTGGVCDSTIYGRFVCRRFISSLLILKRAHVQLVLSIQDAKHGLYHKHLWYSVSSEIIICVSHFPNTCRLHQQPTNVAH
jgi:hypothetical protein